MANEKQPAPQRANCCREIPDTGEEATTAYYDSIEGNTLLLYDPQDENIETDADGFII